MRWLVLASVLVLCGAWIVPLAPARARSPRASLTQPGLASDGPLLFEATIPRPLGLQLGEREGEGVVVLMVYDGGNAALAGIEAGDRIIATSASMGDAMWEKRTLDGVLAAIRTRVDGNVKLRLARDRPGRRQNRPAAWEVPLTFEYEVELSQPLGLGLRQAYASNDSTVVESEVASSELSSADGQSMWVEVSGVEAGSSAQACGRIRAGDVLVATSASLGSSMWEKRTLEGVLSAISTRLFTAPSVTLRFRREREIGVWAAELVQISRGERTSLSLEALAAYRRDRRESRAGFLTAEATTDAVCELCALALARFGRYSSRRKDVRPSERSVDEVLGAAASVMQVAATMSAAEIAGSTAESDDEQGAISGAIEDESRSSSATRDSQSFGSMSDAGADGLIPQTNQSVAESTAAAAAAAVLASNDSFSAPTGSEEEGRMSRGVRRQASRAEVAAALASEAAVAYREGSGRELASLIAMWRRLRLSSLRLNARLTNLFMSAALRCGAPRLASAFFYDATSPLAEAVVVKPRGEPSEVQPDTYLYNTLIKAHGVAGERAEAKAVLQRMRAEGVPPDTYTLNTLMSVCAKAGDRQGMLRYFRAIEEAGLAPTIDSWNVVLDFCSRARQPSQARDVLSRMRASGIEPNAFSYTSMIQAHVRSGGLGGGVDAAARVLGEALSAGVRLDAPAFNALLGGYATQLRWTEATALLRSMPSHGVMPDHISYSLALRACVRARAPEEAVAVLNMMLADGLPPTARAFSMVLSAYAHGGQVREALEILRRMQAEGVPPNRYTFSSMMEACVNGGQPETALAVFEQMTAQGIAPDVVSYTLLVRAHATPQTSRADYVPEAELRTAFATVKQMVDTGIRPNIVTYNALLAGCLFPAAPGGEPRYVAALSVLREMLFSRVSPTTRTFHTLAAIPKVRGTTKLSGREGDGRSSRGRGGSGRGSGSRGGSPSVDRSVRDPAQLTSARLEYFEGLIAEFRTARRQLDGEIYLEILRCACSATSAGRVTYRGASSKDSESGISGILAKRWIKLGIDTVAARRMDATNSMPALFKMRKVHAIQAKPLEDAVEAAEASARLPSGP